MLFVVSPSKQSNLNKSFCLTKQTCELQDTGNLPDNLFASHMLTSATWAFFFQNHFSTFLVPEENSHKICRFFPLWFYLAHVVSRYEIMSLGFASLKWLGNGAFRAIQSNWMFAREWKKWGICATSAVPQCAVPLLPDFESLTQCTYCLIQNKAQGCKKTVAEFDCFSCHLKLVHSASSSW